MRLLQNVIIFLLLFVFVLSCNDDAELKYVLPKSYLPAYPGSYWDYTNGQRVKTDLNYQSHQYEEETNSTTWSPVQMVPLMDGKYVYEYSIYQNSTVYPLKQLLKESAGAWDVDKVNNQFIKREVISTNDTLLVSFADSTAAFDSLKNVIVVVEYMDSLGKGRWNEKEYYAKNIGLVRKEINNPYDTLDPVIVKQIYRYYINN